MFPFYQNNREKIAACILAGGTSKRFDGLDKAWLLIQEKPMIDWTYQCIRYQVSQTAINHNQHFKRYKNFANQYDIQLLNDKKFLNQGPLTGIYTALNWAQSVEAQWLISVPVDMPKLPKNLVQLMHQHALDNSSDVVVATDISTNHHTLALWSTKVQQTIAQQLSLSRNKLRNSFALLNHSTYQVSLTPLANINHNIDLEKFKNQL